MSTSEAFDQQPFKIIMSWDIAPEHEQDYFEFVVREFLPGVQNLGFEINEAWATVYGNRPQIQVGAVMPSRQSLFHAIGSASWGEIHSRLLEYVTNYQQKIVPALTRFQF
jgi:hypothetical protein